MGGCTENNHDSLRGKMKLSASLLVVDLSGIIYIEKGGAVI